MKRSFWIFIVFVVLFTSCGEYQKLYQTGDNELMYKKGLEYYHKGDYEKAMALFDHVRAVYTGTSKGQTVAYYRAYCCYNMKDYEQARELFRIFVSTFADSPYVEECLYMVGYCGYLASPNAQLDQAVTQQALRDFRLYLSRFPNSFRVVQINTYVDLMNDKLSYKEYLSAKNYYHRERYKAAVVSLENCLKDYPSSKYREEIIYMLFNSKYELAVNSVAEKQYERYNAAYEEYVFFMEEYPESAYSSELKRKYDNIQRYLSKFDTDDSEE